MGLGTRGGHEKGIMLGTCSPVDCTRCLSCFLCLPLAEVSCGGNVRKPELLADMGILDEFADVARKSLHLERLQWRQNVWMSEASRTNPPCSQSTRTRYAFLQARRLRTGNPKVSRNQTWSEIILRVLIRYQRIRKGLPTCHCPNSLNKIEGNLCVQKGMGGHYD